MPARPPRNRRYGALDREIFALALPTFATLVTEPLLLIADSAFIGHLGTDQLAGLGIAANLIGIVVGLCIFLAYGTTSTVARRLGAAGWVIVERNARTRHGELDIVARDARALVFVEVKAGREGNDFGPERPVHSVGPQKQRRIRRLASAWIAAHRGSLPFYAEIRFDAVGVSFDRAGRVTEVEHVENAF